MTHATIYYKTQRIKNRRMLTIRKKVPPKRDLTRLFLACLRGMLISLCIASIALTSLMLYKELLQLPFLQVKKIHVEGCLRQNPAQIISLAGIPPQISLLSLDLKDICRRLETSPWIESAQVKRTLPDQLEIRVLERTPVALINLNQLHLVDEWGTVFKKAEREDGLALPILTGITWEDLMKDKKMHTALIKQALTLMQCFERDTLSLGDISEIHIDTIQGLTVFTTHNATQIEMGFAPFHQKVERLYTLLADFEREHLIPENIDLNYRHKAFVKLKPQTKNSKPFKKGGGQQWGKMEI